MTRPVGGTVVHDHGKVNEGGQAFDDVLDEPVFVPRRDDHPDAMSTVHDTSRR